MSRAEALVLGCGLVLAIGLGACGPSIDDLIEDVATSPESRESARQELLLAKERAVAPLLAAIADPTLATGREPLVEALISLMVRVDDPRIVDTLAQLLTHDTDARIRARIARGLGLQRRAAGGQALVEAMGDDDRQVRYEALVALGALGDLLPEDLRQRADEVALTLVSEADKELRMEAKIRVEQNVSEWLQAAQNQELQASLAVAESLYSQALAYYPHSKRANYRLGRFYYDNGQEERGLRLLRQHGMLLDVPRFEQAPAIDGRLDDAAWVRAARADTFYQLSHRHQAALVSELRTELRIGYTPEALFIGFRGYDDDPTQLMVRAQQHDDDVWWEDVIEIFLDADFDRLSYVQVGITSVPVVADLWYAGGYTNDDDEARSFNPDFEAESHVGEDAWSIEYALRFAAPQLTPPATGTVWGFNMSRTYRNTEYAQWVRTSGAHQPNEFGLLRFH